jgi:hypothetical protein
MRERPSRRCEPERHTCVDPILVRAADRGLELVPRPVEVEKITHAHERPRDGNRDVMVGPTARLRVLPKAMCVQQRRESKGQEGKDDSACRRQQLHQKRK